ncbi:MAG: AI-2E family transporter [Actinobacteria bacterium]|nr:MAG: AI-2E family transporter [Actinomycetota bacterium]
MEPSPARESANDDGLHAHRREVRSRRRRRRRDPRVMGRSVGLSPLVTLVSVAVVGVLFGGFAVILAIPAAAAAATLIDVLVLGHDLPPSG